MTADRATLLSLADEVERLEGPDRERDALIWIAVTPDVMAIIRANPGKTYEDLAPAYTASRDAADSLMPKGWFVRVQGEAGACWIVEATGPTEGEYAISDVAKAEPLARTAAALRAMAAGVGDDR